MSEDKQAEAVPVMSELDFSKLGGADFSQEIVLNLVLGGKTIPLQVSNAGVAEKADAWQEENPQPRPKKISKALTPQDPGGKALKAAGYKGSWPAVREVSDGTDDPAFQKASAEWLTKLSWRIVSWSFPAIKNEAGELLETDEDRIAFLKSKRMLDKHAIEVAKFLGGLQAVSLAEQDQEDAGFFAEP